MQLIREKMEEVRIDDLTRDESVIDAINEYFERKCDHDTLRSAIKSRFGVGIKLVEDKANPNAAPYELYSRGEFTTQVDAGLIEAISGGWGQKVIAALATLFTEKGQRYELAKDGNTENLENESETIAKFRKKGGYKSAMVGVDRKAIQCGSGAVFVSVKNAGLSYQVLTPADVRFYWPEKILDGEETRLPDYSDQEDAYAITIRLSQVDANKYSYLAIFGRSEDYPQGRWVQYTADNNSDKIPDVGEAESYDYMISGSVANPLSYFGNQQKDSDEAFPEYPISIIKGPTEDRSVPMPTYTSLYDDDIEFGITASHMLSGGNDAAKGLTVVSLTHEGASTPLPQTLTGVATALPGQEIKHHTKNASDVKTGIESLNMLMVSAASGYSVPDYMVVSEDYALEAASGIALEVKTRPLIKSRENREEQNSEQVSKIFDIEKALLNIHLISEYPEVKSLLGCTMLWIAGPLELPENKKEKSERILSMLEKGVLDPIAAIREYNNFTTDAEAVAEYEKMKKRAAKYPSLAAEKKVPVGLNRRRQENG